MASIATIKSDEDSLITESPALIDIQEQNLCFIEIENCAPYEVRLQRGSTIAVVDHEWEDEIQKFDGRQIDSFISEVRDTASKIQKPVYLTREEIKKRIKMNIPASHKEQYLDLLTKYRSVLSKDKNDLGMAKNFFHRIVLKDDAPVYTPGTGPIMLAFDFLTL